MRRDLAVFLVSGAVLVLALEARTTFACVREGLAGPYPEAGRAVAVEEPAVALRAAEPAVGPRDGPVAAAHVPALLLPSILLVGF